MVFTALFTHNREHFGQALKLSEGLLCHKELVPTNMWNSQRPSSHSNIRIYPGGGGLPPPFLHTQLVDEWEKCIFWNYHKTGVNLTWWQVATKDYTVKS